MHTTIPLPVPCKRAQQGSLDRPEAPSQTEGCLVHSRSASAAGPEARSCLVQPRDRQQAPRLRSRPLAGRRRMRQRQGARPWHRDPEKDRATGPVRNHWSRPEPRSMIGCRRSASGTGATCSRAVSELNRISLLGNTLASSMPGSRVRGSTVRLTAHIQWAGRRRRRFTERPVTFARFSFCPGIRSSKAPSGISGSRSMTLSASQSRSNSEGSSRPCHLAGPQLPGRRCPELPPNGHSINAAAAGSAVFHAN
jgi:hypothetical protein